mmetsp:Transcript_62613/g.93137  ORF Transcript_62613/g.93137 Transcript_62613/m.93137 type:complete len:250 (+) Transcript_62613:127-876(+)
METVSKEEAHQTEIEEMKNLQNTLKTKNTELKEQLIKRSRMFLSVKKKIEKISQKRCVGTVQEEGRDETTATASNDIKPTNEITFESSPIILETREPDVLGILAHQRQSNDHTSDERNSVNQNDNYVTNNERAENKRVSPEFNSLSAENNFLRKRKHSLENQVSNLSQRADEHQEKLVQLATKHTELTIGMEQWVSNRDQTKNVVSRLKEITAKQQELRFSRSKLANSLHSCEIHSSSGEREVIPSDRE